jgi:hypothetical protein
VQKKILSVLLKVFCIRPTKSVALRVAISSIYTKKPPGLLNALAVYSRWISSPLIPQIQKILQIPTNTHPLHPFQNQTAPDPPDKG